MKKSIYYLLCLAWLILLAACGPSKSDIQNDWVLKQLQQNQQKFDSIEATKKHFILRE